MKIKQHLMLDLGGASAVHVDLSKVKMTPKQRKITSKLISKIGTVNIPLGKKDLCEDGKCPASSLLEPDEFAEIRGLKATLGTSGEVAGFVCDFCMHCVAV